MRTKTAGLGLVALLATATAGCAAALPGGGPGHLPTAAAGETEPTASVDPLSDAEAARDGRDGAGDRADGTRSRPYNGSGQSPSRRPSQNAGNDPYLPPQAVVPDTDGAPTPPSSGESSSPEAPEEESGPTRPSFPRVTEPVPVLPPFGEGIVRPGRPSIGNDGEQDAGETGEPDAPRPGMGGNTPIPGAGDDASPRPSAPRPSAPATATGAETTPAAPETPSPATGAVPGTGATGGAEAESGRDDASDADAPVVAPTEGAATGTGANEGGAGGDATEDNGAGADSDEDARDNDETRGDADRRDANGSADRSRHSGWLPGVRRIGGAGTAR